MAQNGFQTMFFRQVSYFGCIFPFCPGEAKTYSSTIFSDFRPDRFLQALKLFKFKCQTMETFIFVRHFVGAERKGRMRKGGGDGVEKQGRPGGLYVHTYIDWGGHSYLFWIAALKAKDFTRLVAMKRSGDSE